MEVFAGCAALRESKSGLGLKLTGQNTSGSTLKGMKKAALGEGNQGFNSNGKWRQRKGSRFCFRCSSLSLAQIAHFYSP